MEEILIDGKPPKAIYVGVDGEAVKIWENGEVLNEKQYKYFLDVMKLREETEKMIIANRKFQDLTGFSDLVKENVAKIFCASKNGKI